MDELSIPAVIATSSIFRELANLPQLRSLEVVRDGYTFSSRPGVCYLPKDGPRPFPALLELCIHGSTSIVRNMLDTYIEVPSLLSLRLSVDSLESPSSIMWTGVSLAFPNLQSLQVHIENIHPDENVARLKLRQLFIFGKLKELRVRHPLPLSVSDPDIRDLLDSCPLLSILSLNPTPLASHRSLTNTSLSVNPTWKAMIHLARRALHLREAAIFLGNPQAGHNLPAFFVNATLQTLQLGSYSDLDCAYLQKLGEMFPACDVKNVCYKSDIFAMSK